MPYDRLRGLIEPIDFTNCTDGARGRIEEELGRLTDGHDIEDLDLYAGLFNMGSLLDHFPREGLLFL